MIFWTSSQLRPCRAALSLLVLLGLVCIHRSRADEVLPKAPPASKYAKMAAHSPFAPPTAPVVATAAATPPPTPGWADNLTVTMIMQDGASYMVTVIDSQTPQQHQYLTSEPDKTSQMAVASVKWGANRDEPPTVTLRRGKEFAQVRYESGTASAGGGPSLGGGPQIPGGMRNLSPGAAVAPGTAGIRPPPLPNAGNGNPGNALRRPLIRSQPAPALTRPGVNPPNTAVRPNPALQVDDDDEDD